MVSKKVKMLTCMLGIIAMSYATIPSIIYADTTNPVENSSEDGIGLTPDASDPSYFTYVTVEGVTIINGYTGTGGDIMVPDTLDGNTVVGISMGAFMDNTTITSVTLPSTIASIEANSFRNCTNLKTINIPEGVTTIKASTFSLSGVEDVTLPTSLISISDSAFQSCFNLKTIIIPEGVESFADTTFSGCSSLTSITFKNANACNGNDEIALPVGTVITGKVPSYAQDYATKYNRTFVNIADGTTTQPPVVIPEPTGTPIERFKQGGNVKISELFPDSNLANYFVSWLTGSVTTAVQEVGVTWSGTVDSKINRDELKYAFDWKHADMLGTFGGSNLGITSLKGMEIFNDYTGHLRFINFSNNYLTSAEGLGEMTSINDLNLSNNKISDLSALSNVTRIYGVFDISFNYITSLNFLNPNILIQAPVGALGWGECTMNISCNYIDTTEASNFCDTHTAIDYGQNGFEFKQAVKPMKATINHYDFNTDGMLDSEMFAINQVLNNTQTYTAKNISGYTVNDSTTQTYTVDAISYTNPTIWLTGPGPAPTRPGSILDYTFTSSDDSVLSYDTTYKMLVPHKAGTVNISVYSNGVFLGTYPVTVLGTSIPNPVINFYYTKNQPTVRSLTVHYVYSDGSTALPEKVVPNTVMRFATEYAPTIQGYDADSDSKSVFISNINTDYSLTFVYSAKIVKNLTIHYVYSDGRTALPDKAVPYTEVCVKTEYAPTIDNYNVDNMSKSINISNMSNDYSITFVYTEMSAQVQTYNLFVNAMTTDLMPIPLADASKLVTPYVAQQFITTTNTSIAAISDSKYEFKNWGVRTRNTINDPWGAETIYLGATLPVVVDKDVVVTAYFDLATVVTPPIVEEKGTINVIYKDLTNNIVLDTSILKEQEIGKEINVYSKTIEDYTLKSASIQVVKLKSSEPVTVEFGYEPTVLVPPVIPPVIPPIVVVKGTINIVCKDIKNNIVLKTSELTNQATGVDIVVNAEVLTGYTLKSVSMKTVKLEETNPIASVEFYYEQTQAPPVVIPPVTPPVEPPTDQIVAPPIAIPITPEPIIPSPIVTPPTHPVETIIPPVVTPVISDPTPTPSPIITPEPIIPVPVVVTKPTPKPNVIPQIVTPVVPVEQTYKLNIYVIGNGKATAKPNKVEYKKGDVVSIDVLPDEGWEYDFSLIDWVNYNAIPDLKMNSDRTVIVHFKEKVAPVVESKTGKVYGVVLGKNGQPIAGILVELHSITRSTYTNEQGMYQFDDVELGKHTVILRNPYSLKEISRIQVIAYEETTDTDDGVAKTVETKELVEQGVSINEKHLIQRIDFNIDLKDIKKPIKIPPVVATLPLLLLGLIRKRNVKVYNLEGRIVKKMHVRVKKTSVIDISNLKGEEFKIVIKNANSFRKVDLLVKKGKNVLAVVLKDKEDFVFVNLTSVNNVKSNETIAVAAETIDTHE